MMGPAWALGQMEGSEEGCTPSGSAITPAGRTCGPVAPGGGTVQAGFPGRAPRAPQSRVYGPLPSVHSIISRKLKICDLIALSTGHFVKSRNLASRLSSSAGAETAMGPTRDLAAGARLFSRNRDAATRPNFGRQQEDDREAEREHGRRSPQAGRHPASCVRAPESRIPISRPPALAA